VSSKNIFPNYKELLLSLSVLLIWIPLLLFKNFIPKSLELWIIIISVGELILLAPVFYFLAKKKINFRNIGFNKFKISGCFTSIGIWILAMVLNIIYILILQQFDKQPQPDLIPLFKELNLPFAIALIFTGGIIAPIVEEVYFRGFLFSAFKSKFNWKYAALISSIIFSFSHILPTSLLPIFVLGLAFAVIYQKTNSIYPSVIIHSANNLLALVSTFIIARGT